MIIKFGDDADSITMGAILEGLAGWTLNIEYTGEGFPKACSIDSTNRDDIVICDVDETGRPMTNCLYHVPYEDIVSITVI